MKISGIYAEDAEAQRSKKFLDKILKISALSVFIPECIMNVC